MGKATRRQFACVVAAAGLLGAVPAHAVVLQQAINGTAGGSFTFANTIDGGTDQAYVLCVSVRNNAAITSIVGGGLQWDLRKHQCADESVSSSVLYTAQGSPPAPFYVSINVASGPVAAVLARYTGVAGFEDPTGHNTNGENGNCNNASDTNVALLTLSSTVNGSVHVIGVASRKESVTSVSTDYSLVQGVSSGGSGPSTTTMRVYHKTYDPAATEQFQATLSAVIDWATAGVVLNPVWTAHYRSIGTDTGILASAGTATLSGGSSTVTFSGTTLPANIGQGDRLTIGGGAPPTLFSDAFGDGTTNGWTCIPNATNDECDMYESGGRFRTDGPGSNSHYAIDAGAAWTDYTFTVDLYAGDDDYMGMTARIQDADNHYLLRQGFGDNPPGPETADYYLRLQKVVSGTATDLASVNNYGTNPGQVDGNGNYVFKLQVSGTSVRAWVDDVLKFDITDSTFASGTAGVWAFSQGDSWFDNASVIGGDDGPYYIYSRDSDTQVTIQETALVTWTNDTYEIERVYNTLQAWENDRDGNLVAEARSEVGVCYNDGPFTGRLLISGSTTDASQYMTLTVASGQRHNGQKNTGAVIDAQGGWGGLNAIDVEDEYTVIDGLEIKAIEDAGSAVFFDDSPAADNGLASCILVHSCLQNGNAGVDIGAQNVAVRNSIFTGETTCGIRLLATGSGVIENCTIVGSPISGDGVRGQAGSTVTIANTISVDHAGGYDFDLSSTITYFGYNMFNPALVLGFDPESCPNCAGGNRQPPADLETLFVSTSPPDYHLEPSGHLAGNTGLNLPSVTDDVDGEARSGTWDMGADEGVAGTNPSVSPRIISWREVEP